MKRPTPRKQAPPTAGGSTKKARLRRPIGMGDYGYRHARGTIPRAPGINRHGIRSKAPE